MAAIGNLVLQRLSAEEFVTQEICGLFSIIYKENSVVTCNRMNMLIRLVVSCKSSMWRREKRSERVTVD